MATKTQARGYQGEDLELLDTLSGSGSVAGWSLLFTLKKTKQDASAILTKTTPAGVQIVDAANRKVAVFLAAADTKPLLPGTYVFDVCRTDGGSKAELSDGTLTILLPVSNL